MPIHLLLRCADDKYYSTVDAGMWIQSFFMITFKQRPTLLILQLKNKNRYRNNKNTIIIEAVILFAQQQHVGVCSQKTSILNVRLLCFLRINADINLRTNGTGFQIIRNQVSGKFFFLIRILTHMLYFSYKKKQIRKYQTDLLSIGYYKLCWIQKLNLGKEVKILFSYITYASLARRRRLDFQQYSADIATSITFGRPVLAVVQRLLRSIFC